MNIERVDKKICANGAKGASQASSLIHHTFDSFQVPTYCKPEDLQSTYTLLTTYI